jgi:uncharacterized protein with beta-barrel porin domain
MVLPTTSGSGDIYANIGAVEKQTTTLEMQLMSNRLAGLAGPTSTSSCYCAANPQSSGLKLVSYKGSDGQVRTLPCLMSSPNMTVWNTWAQGYGLSGSLNGGFNYGLGGTLFGADRWLDENTMVGVLGGYAGTSLGQQALGANAQINGYQVGLYELHRGEWLYLSNIDFFGNDTYNVSRQITLPGTSQTAAGNSYGNQWAHYTELGATLVDRGSFRLQPFTGLQYIYLNQGGYNETGAGNLNLTVNHQIVNSTRGNFGARLYNEITWNGIRFVPMVAAVYQREWGDGSQLVTSSFQGAPTLIYGTAGGKTGRDFGLFTIGGTAILSDHVSLYASLNSQVASYYSAVIGSGGFQFSW